MKLIIYGLGQIFQKYRDIIPVKSVEAFADKNAENGNKLFDIPVITPQHISEYEYDFVVVFSDKYFMQIARELSCECFIPKEKIVSWRAVTGDTVIHLGEVRKYLLDHIVAFHDTSILEFGLDMLYGIISPINGIFKEEISVDGVGEADFPYIGTFYNHLWTDIMKSAAEASYDLVILKPGMLTDALAKKLSQFRIQHLVIIEDYNFERLGTLNLLLETYYSGKINRTLLTSKVIFEITDKNEEYIDCNDYVITHKKYLIEQDGLYKGLSVGNNRIDGLLSELDGDSISIYNDRINETSGLYWMWKNTSSEYVGLSHYRRYFFNNAFQYKINRLNKARIREILCDLGYDIILSELKELDWTIYENINRTVGSDYNSEAYNLFSEAIKEKQPDYVKAFENVMNNNRMYICNMFVTSRKIMDEYCKWLFSFYIDVTDKIDVSQGTVYQKRVAGYYSEVFWTVWIFMQKYKVYELPLTNVWAEND